LWLVLVKLEIFSLCAIAKTGDEQLNDALPVAR
jgi:hypothetical protein